MKAAWRLLGQEIAERAVERHLGTPPTGPARTLIAPGTSHVQPLGKGAVSLEHERVDLLEEAFSARLREFPRNARWKLGADASLGRAKP